MHCKRATLSASAVSVVHRRFRTISKGMGGGHTRAPPGAKRRFRGGLVFKAHRLCRGWWAGILEGALAPSGLSVAPAHRHPLANLVQSVAEPVRPNSKSPPSAPRQCRAQPNQARRNVQRFRGGLVFMAHRLCVSLNSRLESNKEEKKNQARSCAKTETAFPWQVCQLARSPSATPPTNPRKPI